MKTMIRMALALSKGHHRFLNGRKIVQVGPADFIHAVPDALEYFPAFGKLRQQAFLLMGPAMQFHFIIAIGFKFFNRDQFMLGQISEGCQIKRPDGQPQ